MMDFNNFFRCVKSSTHSWYTPNFESVNKKLSFISLAAFSWFNFSVKLSKLQRKGNKITSYHTIVSMEVTSPKKNWAPFSGSPPQKSSKPPGCPISSIPQKNYKLHLLWSLLSQSIYLPHTKVFFNFWKGKCIKTVS